MNKIIITIDGYSGTGKSSTAKMVAEQLGYAYIDSGAMYRAVTFLLLDKRIDLSDLASIKEVLRSCDLSFKSDGIYLNGESIESKIRTMEINQNVSPVSAISEVRRKLVEQQRIMGREKGVVMDGRDIGTVVFPQAELKIFMTADVDVRTERRRIQLLQKGVEEELELIKKNLLDRDQKDTSRADSPLKKAEGAIEIDTSQLTLNQQVDKIVALAGQIIDED